MLLIVMSPFIALSVMAQSNTPWGLDITPAGCNNVWEHAPLAGVTLMIGITGPKGPFDAGILLSGGVTWYDPSSGSPLESASLSFTPNNFDWATGVNQSIGFGHSGVRRTINPICSGWVALSVNGNQEVNQTFTGGSGANPTYTLGIEIPLINDPMLGASVPPKDQSGNQNPILPVDLIYNFIMVIALIVISVGVAIALFTGQSGREKEGGLSTVLMQVVTSVVIILIFPLVYDQVAQLINYMSQSIIAFPNPPSAYNQAIQRLWDSATAGGGSWTSVITSSLIDFAVWIMELVASLMMYFLGTVRILLLGVMIAGFPLAVALKMIPFTSKLSQMIEDTLFGLVLAAIMSAVIAGVAGQILTNFSGSFFEQAVGPQANWVAIAAIFGIILMPTVFAPLTAVMMQTVSQTAMTAGGVAAAVGAGVGGPAAGGVVAGGKAGFGAVSAAAGSGAGFGGQLSAGLSSFAGTFKSHAAMPMLKNAAIVATTGIATALGGSQVSRVMRGAMPQITGPGDVLQSARQAQQTGVVSNLLAQNTTNFEAVFNQAGSLTPAVRAQQQAQLGGHYLDPTTPQGQQSINHWFSVMKASSPQTLAEKLATHGKIDVNMYHTNQAYRDGIHTRIAEFKQKLDGLDPAKATTPALQQDAYQKLADVRNSLNV